MPTKSRLHHKKVTPEKEPKEEVVETKPSENPFTVEIVNDEAETPQEMTQEPTSEAATPPDEVETEVMEAPEKEVEVPITPEATPQEPQISDIPDSSTTSASSISEPSRSFPKKTLVITFIMFVVGLGLGIGVGMMMKKSPDAQNGPSPSPVASAIETKPSPSPSPIVDKAALTIEILNGSGVKGAAAKAKELLEKEGYKNITTGNADKSTYTETELHVSEKMKGALDELKAVLGKEYTVGTADAELTSKTKDVQIILGKE